MNTTSEVHAVHAPASRSGVRIGGAAMEILAAVAVIAITIIGLAQVLPEILAAVAVLVFSGIVLTQGAAFGLSGVRGQTFDREALQEASGGVSIGFVAGVAGIVLGVLALLNVAPMVLLSVALLVFGAAYLLATFGGAMLSRQAVSYTFGGQFLIAIAAVVLGILAVIGLSQLVLVLVGFLCLGVGALMTGGALAASSSQTQTIQERHETRTVA